MNPHWADSKALIRGDGVPADPAMAAIVFKTTLSAMMKSIQQSQIRGTVWDFVWRIGHRKRGLPYAHIFFWTDLNTQDIHAVGAVSNVRHRKDSPFLDYQSMAPDFRQLIDAYQIHSHSKRCRPPNGKSRLGYS
jgi:hypothetical protein